MTVTGNRENVGTNEEPIARDAPDESSPAALEQMMKDSRIVASASKPPFGWNPHSRFAFSARDPRGGIVRCVTCSRRADRAYAEDMVEDHQKAVKLFQKCQRGSANHELLEFGRQTLPILREHLTMPQKMETTLAGT